MIQDTLRKPTNNIIKNNRKFFESLDNSISNVYSYGFSYSAVDKPYIKEIIKRLDTRNMVWHLSNYNDSLDRCNYKKTIRKCGYKGKFSLF